MSEAILKEPVSASSPSDADASRSPLARGRETRTALLQKLRPPPLIHSWDFWLEKEAKASTADAAPSAPASGADAASTTAVVSTPHNTTLTQLLTVTDLKNFWNLMNNFSFSTLPPRMSAHLFHSTVRPLWEDKRNVAGGAWTFRIPRNNASPFFRALALLAVGEQLQEAVSDDKKVTFRDDICGISFTVRNERMIAISVWNRDAGNEEGKARLLDIILNTVPPQTRPAEGAYYYKKHADHVGFGVGTEKTESGSQKSGAKDLAEAREKSEAVSQSVEDIEREYEKVRKILEEVKLKEKEMVSKLAKEVERAEAEADSGSKDSIKQSD